MFEWLRKRSEKQSGKKLEEKQEVLKLATAAQDVTQQLTLLKQKLSAGSSQDFAKGMKLFVDLYVENEKFASKEEGQYTQNKKLLKEAFLQQLSHVPEIDPEKAINVISAHSPMKMKAVSLFFIEIIYERVVQTIDGQFALLEQGLSSENFQVPDNIAQYIKLYISIDSLNFFPCLEKYRDHTKYAERLKNHFMHRLLQVSKVSPKAVTDLVTPYFLIKYEKQEKTAHDFFLDIIYTHKTKLYILWEDILKKLIEQLAKEPEVLASPLCDTFLSLIGHLKKAMDLQKGFNVIECISKSLFIDHNQKIALFKEIRKRGLIKEDDKNLPQGSAGKLFTQIISQFKPLENYEPKDDSSFEDERTHWWVGWYEAVSKHIDVGFDDHLLKELENYFNSRISRVVSTDPDKCFVWFLPYFLWEYTDAEKPARDFFIKIIYANEVIIDHMQWHNILEILLDTLKEADNPQNTKMCSTFFELVGKVGHRFKFNFMQEIDKREFKDEKGKAIMRATKVKAKKQEIKKKAPVALEEESDEGIAMMPATKVKIKKQERKKRVADSTPDQGNPSGLGASPPSIVSVASASLSENFSKPTSLPSAQVSSSVSALPLIRDRDVSGSPLVLSSSLQLSSGQESLLPALAERDKEDSSSAQKREQQHNLPGSVLAKSPPPAPVSSPPSLPRSLTFVSNASSFIGGGLPRSQSVLPRTGKLPRGKPRVISPSKPGLSPNPRAAVSHQSSLLRPLTFASSASPSSSSASLFSRSQSFAPGSIMPALDSEPQEGVGNRSVNPPLEIQIREDYFKPPDQSG